MAMFDTSGIVTRINAILAELPTVRSGPNYSIDGQSVSMEGYRASLLAELAQLRAMLQDLDGPYEIESVGG